MAFPNALSLAFNTVRRVLPAALGDGIPAENRGTRYGELVVQPIMVTKHALSDEGSYFVVTNPTPGTKVDYGSAGTQASFSDTVPFMVFQNLDTVGQTSSKRMFLDYVKLVQIGGTAPASTTSVQMAAKLDASLRSPASGTLTTGVPVCSNMDSNVKPIGQVLYPAGALATLPAASSAARIVARDQLKGGPTLLLDQHNLVFGNADVPAGQGYLTTVASYWNRFAPIEIGPQQSLVLHLWFPAGVTNPYSFEFECAWWER